MKCGKLSSLIADLSDFGQKVPEVGHAIEVTERDILSAAKEIRAAKAKTSHAERIAHISDIAKHKTLGTERRFPIGQFFSGRPGVLLSSWFEVDKLSRELSRAVKAVEALKNPLSFPTRARDALRLSKLKLNCGYGTE